jgi:hypothetical protein
MRVELKESNELFGNPGMGWQTFQRFADNDPNLAGLPSTVAYFRYYWREFEPADGEYDFTLIDRHVAHARAAGQQLAFRIMCCGTDDHVYHSPEWLRKAGCRGFEYQYQGKGTVHWAPDMDDPLFREKHFRFLVALGKRYNGHPDVDLIDIGTVGLWGEWHMSETRAPLPSPETIAKIHAIYLKLFKDQPLVYLVGDSGGMMEAGRRGVGWRADCLGDMGGFSKTWNHMEHYYKQQIAKTGAQDVWKTCAVAWESCWDVQKWVDEEWDVRAIYDYALDLHGSYENNKSKPLPAEARGETERFLKKLGYRLALRTVGHRSEVKPGEGMTVEMSWKNVGVAPPYRDWRIALQLVSTDGHAVAEAVTETSVKGWLPGGRTARGTVLVPRDAAEQKCSLRVALVNPRTGKPAVRLATLAPEEGLWYRVSDVAVRR